MASNPNAKQKSQQYKKLKFVDRRSGEDRRTQYEGRLVYDMRQKKGRRSSDRNHPTIEVDA